MLTNQAIFVILAFVNLHIQKQVFQSRKEMQDEEATEVKKEKSGVQSDQVDVSEPALG